MDKHFKTARILAKLLDSQFSFLGIKFGLDPIINLIPGLGDIIGAILSLYIIWVGIKLKIPSKQIYKMIRNVILDFLLGLFPIIGSVADLFYKANQKNLKILEKYYSNIIEGEIVNK